MGNTYSLEAYDSVPEDKKQALFGNLKKDENKSGFERLTDVFTIRDHNVFSPELEFAKTSFFCGFFTGGAVGSFYRAQETYFDFIKHHQATAFTSHNEAKKQLQDKITLNGAKAFLKYGFKLGAFTGSLGLVLTLLGAYRGQIGVTEYAITGAVVGGASRVSFGPKGAIAGAIVGSALTTLLGGVAVGVAHFSGLTVEEIIYREREHRLQQELERQEKIRTRMRLAEMNANPDHTGSTKALDTR